MGTDFRIALMLFTVLAPAGAIAFVLMSVRIMSIVQRTPIRERMERCLVLPIGLCLVGLISSATHLGTPDNALYVLAGIGRSPLSEEVLAAVVFIAISWLYWLVAFVRQIPLHVSRAFLALACVAAFWLVYRISTVYSIPTIPTWNSPFIPLELWSVALTSGPMVCLAIFAWMQRSFRDGEVVAPRAFYGFLVGVSFSAFVVSVGLALLQNQELGVLSGSYGLASDLFPFYGASIFAFAALGALGEVAAVLSIRKRNCPRPLGAATAVLLVIAAAIVIRVPFYTMHMTIGY
uniref:DMSO reductase n=1 Tax=Muribaculaceae bacterium Z82 TaxID=2304548 RepID=A0A7C9JE23_9BACT